LNDRLRFGPKWRHALGANAIHQLLINCIEDLALPVELNELTLESCEIVVRLPAWFGARFNTRVSYYAAWARRWHWFLVQTKDPAPQHRDDHPGHMARDNEGGQKEKQRE
jgi:hypothetical protein